MRKGSRLKDKTAEDTAAVKEPCTTPRLSGELLSKLNHIELEVRREAEKTLHFWDEAIADRSFLPAAINLANYLKNIVGIDLAEVYLESARQTIQDTRVSFKVGDATNLPFADKSFDRAFSMLVLQFVPDAKKAVSEMRRVVRPGGVVAATVWDALGGMPALRLFWHAAATLGLADDKAMRYFYFRPDVAAGRNARRMV